MLLGYATVASAPVAAQVQENQIVSDSEIELQEQAYSGAYERYWIKVGTLAGRTVLATDKDGGVSAEVVRSIAIQSILIGDGCCDAQALVIGGTAANDRIRIVPVGTAGDVQVLVNGQSLGEFVASTFTSVAIFGMDGDDESVFERTVEWAIEHGIETATFHILTPYPGTQLYRRIEREGRITERNWDLYDTRHTVFRPARLSGDALERGYWRAYRDFYRWGSIWRGARAHDDLLAGARHAAYAAGWKKFEPLWDLVIRAKRAGMMLPALEAILGEFGRRGAGETGPTGPLPKTPDPDIRPLPVFGLSGRAPQEPISG